jgi:REP element-mobilizing transposase RayT
MVPALPRGMTLPRRICPGDTVMVSARCFERRFFLRPSDDVNALCSYLLAVASTRFGILLHAFTFLSNHFHAVLTDPEGKLPAFMQYFCALLARYMNHRLGRSEKFWSSGAYNMVVLETAEDVFDKLAYVLANPVSAALVPRASEWPGLWTSPDQIGAGPRTVNRPERFFLKEGPLPETAQLELVCPTGFDSVEELRSSLSAELAEREQLAERKLDGEGRTFLGAQKALAQDPFDRPNTAEPRHKLKPRIACLDKEKRVAALLRLRAFFDSYRLAWLEFAEGLRDTMFPHGTYWMKIAYGVRCEAAA